MNRLRKEVDAIRLIWWLLIVGGCASAPAPRPQPSAWDQLAYTGSRSQIVSHVCDDNIRDFAESPYKPTPASIEPGASPVAVVRSVCGFLSDYPGTETVRSTCVNTAEVVQQDGYSITTQRRVHLLCHQLKQGLWLNDHIEFQELDAWQPITDFGLALRRADELKEPALLAKRGKR